MNAGLAHKEEAEKKISQCFRHEYRKLMGILAGLFGVQNIELAEDVIQDTFIEALKHWSKNGIPENTAGWLYQVARNKALNVLKRSKYQHQYVADAMTLTTEVNESKPFIENISIEDEQLKMMFVCCHPSISVEAQMAIILKTLCGFSVDEIATAFLNKKETISKRLTRARVAIRKAKLSLKLPDTSKLNESIDTVLKTIYLLYNEGYNASKGSNLIRKELCIEALHLGNILAATVTGNLPKTHALLALMYFNFSRFDARQDNDGNIILLEDQNRKLWNTESIALGFYHLSKITQQEEVSTYHLQAAIAACHASAKNYEQTDWRKILELYEYLYLHDPTPVILLNKAVALSHAKGDSQALRLLNSKEVANQLTDYYLYHTTRANLYIKKKDYREAIDLLNRAIKLTKIEAEKKLITRRLEYCLAALK